jgi:hypothetical protein
VASGLRRFARNDDLEGPNLTRQKNGKAFDKIKTGLDQARAYLDGSVDKREFRLHTPTSESTGLTLPPAQPSEDAP